MDEMGVGIDYHRQLFWIKPGEVRPVRESHPTKLRLNVWGAIWYDGKTTLHVTKENFDQDYYVAVLQEHLAPELPLGRKRFIQDRVPWQWTGWYWIGVRATEFRLWKISQPNLQTSTLSNGAFADSPPSLVQNLVCKFG